MLCASHFCFLFFVLYHLVGLGPSAGNHLGKAMNKRIFMAIIIATVITGFSAHYCTEWASTIDASKDTKSQQQRISQLTHQQSVVSYLHEHQRLPDYYITKKQAREQGWEPRDGNLCSVLPGKAIGGDQFSNRKGQLPSAHYRVWHEADINYRCGRRGADRLLYSNDGLIFVSRDHHKNFIRVE